jgi:hypothetical protein
MSRFVGRREAVCVYPCGRESCFLVHGHVEGDEAHDLLGD